MRRTSEIQDYASSYHICVAAEALGQGCDDYISNRQDIDAGKTCDCLVNDKDKSICIG